MLLIGVKFIDILIIKYERTTVMLYVNREKVKKLYIVNRDNIEQFDMIEDYFMSRKHNKSKL